MKTNVAGTSVQNYHNAATSAAFDALKVRIIDLMEHGRSYTRREVGALVGVDHSCASGRVNELVAVGALIECGTAPRGVRGRTVGLVTLSLAV